MKWPAERMLQQRNKGFGLYEQAMSLQREGHDVIHLGVGRPSDDTPSHIKEAAKAALDAGIVHYGDLQGSPALREALASRFQRERGLPATATEVLITNGVTQAAFATFMAALDPGDEVIVPEPYYPQHLSKIAFAGATPVFVPRPRSNGRFGMDVAAIEAAVTPRTKMIVLVNPCNPTGTVYTPAELSVLAELCIRRDLLVLADEVYEYIVFDDHRHASIAALPGMWERTITVSAFTKAYAMDGWRIGYAVAPAHFIADLRRVTMNDTTHPCVFAQEGAVAAVIGPQQSLREMVAADRRRRDLMVDRLNAMPGVNCARPEGSVYVFPEVSSPGVRDELLAQDILRSAFVAVESGSFYGDRGRGHLRLCFASEPAHRIEQAMDRLDSYFRARAG